MPREKFRSGIPDRTFAFVRRECPVRNSRSELLPGHLWRYSTERSPEPLGGKMNITMKDRVAVVTGASKGIGIAVARRFAEAGARVAILARGTADLKAARERLAKDGLQVHD